MTNIKISPPEGWTEENVLEVANFLYYAKLESPVFEGELGCIETAVDILKHLKVQNQELAELRERYPDALFQAEDLLRQVKLLESTLERAELACSEAMRKADDHRRQRDELELQLKARHDELGFDAARAESMELERDRAKAETQRAQQELQILKNACRLDLEDSLRTVKERISAALQEIK